MGKKVTGVLLVVAGVAAIAFSGGIAGALAPLLGSAITAGVVTSVGISLALAGVSSVLMKTPKINTSIGDRLSVNYDATAPRRIIFGRTAAGSDVRFKETHGTKSDRLSLVLALASHKISAVNSISFDGAVVWQNGSLINSTGLQKLQPVLVGTSTNGQPHGTGAYWTSSSTFTGCAYSLITYIADSKLWPKGLPQSVIHVVEGCPVYDPRFDGTRGGSGPVRYNDQSTWRFNADGTPTGLAIGRNPALALLTYIIGYRINGKLAWGMGLPIDKINVENFILYTNICEEQVLAKGGGYVQRYTCDGIFSTNDTHESVINTICASMGTAVLIDLDGVYQLVGGYDDTLTTPLAFTGDDILSGGEWNKSPPIRDRHTRITGRFGDPSQDYKLNDWGLIELDPLFDGIPRTNNVDLGCVSRAETAQRIGKQMLVREKYSGTYTAVFGPRAFGVSVGSLMTLSLAAHGFNSKLFRVESQSETNDLQFTMILREESPEIYQWDKDEAKALPNNILTTVFDPIDAASVAGLSISARSVGGANSVTSTYIDVVWSLATSARVVSIEIQAKEAGVDTWSTVCERGNDTGALTFSSSVNGAAIEVRARYRMANGINGPFATSSLSSTPVSTVNRWDFVTDGGTGKKPVDFATNTRLDATLFGSTGKTVGGVVSDLATIVSSPSLDTIAPAVPTGLTGASTINTDPVTGERVASLSFSWTANTDSDFDHYELEVTESGAGSATPYISPTNSFTINRVLANTLYTARIKAVDKASNRSTFSTTINVTSAKKSGTPTGPTGLVVSPALTSNFLLWTNSSDVDSDKVLIYSNDVNNSSTATLIGTVNAAPGKAGSHAITGIPTGVIKYYWLRGQDTSGNLSPISASGSTTTSNVQNADIVAGTIGADRLLAYSVTAAQISTTADLWGTITVNGTGVSIGTMQTRSADPATRINAFTTQIDPGRVQISGGTSLANWRYSGDQTLINGGALGARTVSADKVAIGVTGVQFKGVSFDTNRVNSVSWSAGGVQYVDPAGARVEYPISAGSATWSSGTLYIWYSQGTGALSTGTSHTENNNDIVVGVYQGGTNLNISWGQTIIDGDYIKTGTISTGHISTLGLDAGVLKAGTALVGSLTVAGTPLTTVASNAASGASDPASRINAGSTTINGGKITTNTILAQHMVISSRGGTNCVGIEFEHNYGGVTNRLHWTSGYIIYRDSSGNWSQQAISAGQHDYPGSGTSYIWWAGPGNSSFLSGNDVASGGAVPYATATDLHVCTYQGGTNKRVLIGGTIIDGNSIKTGTLTADRVVTNSLTVNQMAYGAGGQASLWINEQPSRGQWNSTSSFTPMAFLQLESQSGQPIVGNFSCTITTARSGGFDRVLLRVRRVDYNGNQTVIKGSGEFGGFIAYGVDVNGTSLSVDFVDTVPYSNQSCTWYVDIAKGNGWTDLVIWDSGFMMISELSRMNFQHTTIATYDSSYGPGVGTGGGGNVNGTSSGFTPGNQTWYVP